MQQQETNKTTIQSSNSNTHLAKNNGTATAANERPTLDAGSERFGLCVGHTLSMTVNSEGARCGTPAFGWIQRLRTYWLRALRATHKKDHRCSSAFARFVVEILMDAGVDENKHRRGPQQLATVALEPTECLQRVRSTSCLHLPAIKVSCPAPFLLARLAAVTETIASLHT